MYGNKYLAEPIYSEQEIDKFIKEDWEKHKRRLEERKRLNRELE